MGLLPWPSCKDRNTKPEAVTLAPGSLAAAWAKSFCAQEGKIEKVQRPSAMNKHLDKFTIRLSFQSIDILKRIIPFWFLTQTL